MTLAHLPSTSPSKPEPDWQLLDTLPLHVATVDNHGVVTGCNRAWRAFGHAGPGQNLLQTRESETTEPLVRSTLHLGLAEVLSGSRPSFEIEYPRRRSPGTAWLEMTAYARPGGALVTQSDVTSRRETDARRSRERTAARIDHAMARAGQVLIPSIDLPEALNRLCRLTAELLDCDTSHTILWQEEDGTYLAAASHGDPPEHTEVIENLRLPRHSFTGAVARGEDADVCQLDFCEVGPVPLRPLAQRLGIRRLLQIALRHGNRPIGFQTACRRNDRPFTDEEEQLAARLGQLASLAIENARLVGQLGEAGRLKTEFVATVSHELRTPIHVVLGFAELLLDGEFGDLKDEQRDALGRILFGARSLLELSEAALQLTRLEAGRFAVKGERIDLGDLFQEAENEVRGTQRDTRVPIEREIATGVEQIHSDRGKLKLILKNLLSNGLKFTDQGSVTLSAKPYGGDVLFVVQDTGVGIEEGALSTIFDAFRQADGSAARRYGGVGLGLHIVRRVVERLGGTVRAQSTLGEGSRFEVLVPSIEPSAITPSRG